MTIVAIRRILFVFMLVLLLCISALTIQAQSDAIVISEIYYNPAATEEGSEYLVLSNPSDGAQDLSGWSFTDGITVTLATGTQIGAGDTLVIASDATMFEAEFGFAPSVTFESGALSNGGETLILSDDVGNVIDLVTYDDDEPWPLSADGMGDSLHLLALDADNNDVANWGAAPPTMADGAAGDASTSDASTTSDDSATDDAVVEDEAVEDVASDGLPPVEDAESDADADSGPNLVLFGGIGAGLVIVVLLGIIFRQRSAASR